MDVGHSPVRDGGRGEEVLRNTVEGRTSLICSFGDRGRVCSGSRRQVERQLY